MEKLILLEFMMTSIIQFQIFMIQEDKLTLMMLIS
jgi:hypothetical protein